jgi:hypothetical protein
MEKAPEVYKRPYDLISGCLHGRIIKTAVGESKLSVAAKPEVWKNMIFRMSHDQSQDRY